MDKFVKIGLIGGEAIKKYTIAPFVWEKIAEIAKMNLIFEVFPISSEEMLMEFYDDFLKDDAFIGFNIALPWKSKVLSLIPKEAIALQLLPCVNAVYKKNGTVQCANTDVLGIQYPLSKQIDINGKSILILGEGDAGIATAVHLQANYTCSVFTYDIKKERLKVEGVTQLSYSSLSEYIFDVIINASTVGKYLFEKKSTQYELPISISLFSQITHKHTVIQEMNYFPEYTELLHLANKMNLKTITGLEMLIIQAVETFYLYTGMKLSPLHITEIHKYMKYVCNSLITQYESTH